MPYIQGIRKVEYQSKKTGNPVKGYSFYLTAPRDDVVGQETFDAFLREEDSAPLLRDVKQLSDLLGLEVRVNYNRYGRAEGIELI